MGGSRQLRLREQHQLWLVLGWREHPPRGRRRAAREEGEREPRQQPVHSRAVVNDHRRPPLWCVPRTGLRGRRAGRKSASGHGGDDEQDGTPLGFREHPPAPEPGSVLDSVRSARGPRGGSGHDLAGFRADDARPPHRGHRLPHQRRADAAQRGRCSLHAERSEGHRPKSGDGGQYGDRERGLHGHAVTLLELHRDGELRHRQRDGNGRQRLRRRLGNADFHRGPDLEDDLRGGQRRHCG